MASALVFPISSSGDLHLSADLGLLLKEPGRLLSLKNQGITEILVITDFVPEVELRKCAWSIRGEGIRIRQVPVSILTHPGKLARMGGDFLGMLGGRSALVLTTEEERELGLKLAGALVLLVDLPLGAVAAPLKGNFPAVIAFLERFRDLLHQGFPEEDQAALPASVKAAYRNQEPAHVRFSIKLKLIGIISAIILISLTGMIGVATVWFKSDTLGRVLESNLQLAEALGLRIRTELVTVLRNAPLALRGEAGDYFLRNGDVLAVARMERNADTLQPAFLAINPDRLAVLSQDEAQVRLTIERLVPRLLPAEAGAEVVLNASPEAGYPLLVLAERAPEGLHLVLMDASRIQRDFAGLPGQEALTRFYLVDPLGDVIAHPDESLVLSRASLTGVPIVGRMLQSRILSEQTPYTDPQGKRQLAAYRKLELGGIGVIAESEEDRALEAVYSIQYRNMLVLLIALSVSIVIVYLFARSLTVPLVRLVEGVKSIARGEYELHLEATSRDELGLLTDSFSDMARGLAERERIKDAFGKFVNKELAEMALKGEIKLGGERKECAVFFSDLRGFTAMSEKMDPEEVVEYLNQYFTVMVRCVNETHGVVDKFIGDAVMAHWGAIGGQGNPTINAINAALAMRRALLEFNRAGEGNRPRAAMGCGINSGPVVAGQIGSAERLDFTVIGDTVNLASRIESLNKPFGTDLLISHDSFLKTEDQFVVVPMPAIKVKGKEEPQTIYTVLGRRDDPSCPGSLEDLRKRLGIEMKDKVDASSAETEEKKYEILES
ncbi:MAG: HAMP domain-containing protein [Spirochaetales bacterium]|nr:HAMP domain-containing protein [Spirochaetales bacterium]